MKKNKEKLIDLLKDGVYGISTKLYEPEGHEDSFDGIKKEMHYQNAEPPDDKWFDEKEKNMRIKFSPQQRIDHKKFADELINFGFNKTGPYTLEEAKTPRMFPELMDLKFDPIPVSLYNKKFSIDDFTVYIQYEKRFSDNSEEFEEEKAKYDKSKEVCQMDAGHRGWICHYQQWNVIVGYHGFYKILGKVQLNDNIEYEFNFPERYRKTDKIRNNNREWSPYHYHIKLTDEKPCTLTKQIKSLHYLSFYELLLDFFKLLDVSDLKIEDCDIDFQDWHNHNQKERKGTKSIDELKNEQLDFEWFVKTQVKDGVYSPTRSIIDMIYTEKYDWDFKSMKYVKLDKNLLYKLGINQIVMKDTVHFNAPEYYNMKGIKIKAPKKVIKKYGFEKYCSNAEIVDKIKKDEEDDKKKEALAKYNNTFTLMFHDKVVLKDKYSENIIEYLENKSARDMEKEVVESVKPIFEAFPKINKIELATFGTHYMYELAGEKHFDTDLGNEHIDKEIWEQIIEFYKENIYVPDEELLKIRYGWPERGAMMFGVQKTKTGKLKVFVEESNACEI